MAFLITIVLGNEVQIVTTNDDGAFHLGAHHSASNNASSD